MEFLNSTLRRKDSDDFEASNETAELRSLVVLFGKSSGPDGRRLRFSPVRKTLRFHAPFLSISSRDSVGLSLSEPIDDRIEEDDEESDETDESADQNRKKRSADSKYYEYYHPFDTAYTTSPNDVGFNWKSISSRKEEQEATTTSDFVQRGPSVLRRNGNGRRNHKKSRRGSLGRRRQDQYLSDGNDAANWSPLEHEEVGKGKNRKKKYGKVLKAKDGDQNPTTVVLLEGKDESANAMTCQRNDLVVDFRDIGWGDYVIAPSSFEAHYCAGSCPFPIPSVSYSFSYLDFLTADFLWSFFFLNTPFRG